MLVEVLEAAVQKYCVGFVELAGGEAVATVGRSLSYFAALLVAAGKQSRRVEVGPTLAVRGPADSRCSVG